MTTQSIQSQKQQRQIEALQSRMIRSAEGVFTSFSIYIGHALGFYRVLSRHPAMTSTELASAAETHERYTREWLEQQTTADIIEVDDPRSSTFERRYTLPPAYAEVLSNQESADYLAPLAELLVGVTRPLRPLLDCYRHGGGIQFSEYGAEMRSGQAGINRVTFLSELGEVWLRSSPELSNRLENHGARAMDFGCGCGWSSIALAETFPRIHVDAYDLDRASIEEARRNAIEHRVADRVTFHCEDVATVESDHRYDLVLFCETLHDLADPVNALAVARAHLKPEGTTLVVDERVADRFMGEEGDLDWMMYGWSILHCLPVGMANGGDIRCGGTGTVMRMPTLQRYALSAGFEKVSKLPVTNLFFNVYRLEGDAPTRRSPLWNENA